ncbi:hypothetical protein L1987_55248 [Smallanthus sonchifolius]|uniref:Uncharacterized protein n=1 Tax=Smallanthus sonchifolius TaxID=185202 RepID=A0ACB9E9E4_9ASTR|nr:hypothetical protein L1987_55248 [Smallanthus sonchifolius]
MTVVEFRRLDLEIDYLIESHSNFKAFWIVFEGTNGRTGSKDELTENSSNGNGEREAILEGEKHPVDEDEVSRWRDKLREEKEKINRGDYQSGAKRGAINNQRYIINENETTLFLTNLPDDASTLMLRNSFRHLPNMSDAFVPRKKDRRGNIFGFIRFESVKNVDYLINEVKKDRVGSAKIGVNA